MEPDLKLKSVRAGHKGAITKLLKRFDDNGGDFEEDDLLTLIDTLSVKRDILATVNEKIIQQTTEEDIADEIADSDEYLFDLDRKIRKIKKLANTNAQNKVLNPNADNFVPNTQMPSVNHVTQSLENAGPTHAHTSLQLSESIPLTQFTRQSSSVYSDYHKLPKLNLPTFSGSTLDWLSFWDSYESAIHRNPSLSEVQKFNYLKSLLHGDASQTITGFSMTNTNYEKAISLLQERYGQTHKIIQTYMQALLDIPPPLNTVDSLRIYCDKMETYVRGLESLGQTDDTYGSLLVPIILNKLPGEISKNLAREHKSTNWILSDLRIAIRNELDIMEAGNSFERLETPIATAAFFTRTNARETNQAHKETDETVERPDRNTKTCAFCKAHDHASANCTIFKTAPDRLIIVKRDRLCFNCLGRHRVADCKSTNNCWICDNRHHTSICGNNEVDEKGETQSGAVLHSSLTQRVLLKTAIASVRAEDHTTEANILLDEGAQTSFITQALAAQLNLKTDGEEIIELASFGDQGRQVKHMKSATIYLQAEEGDEIGMKVLVVLHIAAPIESHINSIANMTHLRGLKLAHPVSADNLFEINILIGADHYWDIVGDKVIRGNGPTAMESKLGYLISGPITQKTTANRKNSAMTVMVTQGAEGLKSENYDPISYQISRYTANRKRKSDHSPLPVKESLSTQRIENVDEPLMQPQLLYGRRISTLPYPGNGHISNSPGFVNHDTLNNVHCSQQNIINQFWHKWKHEYLTSLREYHRNTGSGSQRIRAGDGVLVHDDLPRTSWTLAIVDKLNTGGDGIARSAVIRTKNGLTSRPVTKLYPLEVPPSEADVEDSSDNDSERLCRKAKREAIEKIKKLR